MKVKVVVEFEVETDQDDEMDAYDTASFVVQGILDNLENEDVSGEIVE